MTDLRAFVRVAIDQETCIGCGACIEACPHNALEFDDNVKARLVWDLCRDDFSCIEVCPVDCIHRVNEASQELLSTEGWYRLSPDAGEDVLEALEDWREKYGVEVGPV